jgi:hypothetical protein
MGRERCTVFPIGFAILGILFASWFAMGRETEDQLLQRTQGEQNPIKKARDEIKLGNLKLEQIQDAYSQGHTESGAKLLATLVEIMKTSWKLLHDAGGMASKQEQGLRELEISLREDVRVLQDLGRTVSYFDRAPMEKAAQDLEQIRSEVIHAQFPGRPPRTLKGSPPPQTTASPESPGEAR